MRLSCRNLCNKTNMKNNIDPFSIAGWLSPEGNFIGLHGSHTSTVLENPKVFGLSTNEAESLFSCGEEEASLEIGLYRELDYMDWSLLKPSPPEIVLK